MGLSESPQALVYAAVVTTDVAGTVPDGLEDHARLDDLDTLTPRVLATSFYWYWVVLSYVYIRHSVITSITIHMLHNSPISVMGVIELGYETGEIDLSHLPTIRQDHSHLALLIRSGGQLPTCLEVDNLTVITSDVVGVVRDLYPNFF